METVAAVRTPTTSDRRFERAFYTGMAVVFIGVVFAGFARTYYLRSMFGSPELDWGRHLHGAVFSAWLVLLAVQASLVAARRTDLHRRLGTMGLGLAIAMIVIGTWTALVRAKLIALPPGAPPPLAFLTIPLGDVVVFGALFSLAYRWRRKLDYHKRLMLLATIAILPAAVARLPFAFILEAGPIAFFALADLFIVFCAIFDLATLKRIHPATLWGGLFVIISHPLRLIIGSTPAWLSFAERLTSWVG
jgi:hypothetical protein